MAVSTDLLSQLTQLAEGIGVGREVLHVPLKALAGGLNAAVTSYRGLQLTIVHSGQPVTLTDMVHSDGDGAVLTSLRVPLIAMNSDYGLDSRVIFYAGKPGALIDLAADLGYVLKTSVLTKSSQSDSDNDGQPKRGDLQATRILILDADVPTITPASRLSGLSELSAVNRAMGLMIGRGHHPDGAYEALRREAAAAGVDTHVYAARMLGD